jgi:hypothetical protein
MSEMIPVNFIAKIAPIAMELSLEGSPIFPSIRIAQAALETNWTIHSWNNMVGFKVGSGRTNAYWKGDYVTKGTWEVYDGKRSDVQANFRAYDSIEDSFRDQDLLFRSSRYAPVRNADTPEEQAHALYASGYATDPLYAQKILNIVNQYGLKAYDAEVVNMLKAIEELQRRVAELETETAELEAEVTALREKDAMAEVPVWAKEAVNAAVKKGIIDTPKQGSYDFYRLITVLHRKGLI